VYVLTRELAASDHKVETIQKQAERKKRKEMSPLEKTVNKKLKSPSNSIRQTCMTEFVKGPSKNTTLVKKNSSNKPSKVVSDEILPELCKRISVNGTSSKQKLIKKFVDDFPNTSARQVTFKFIEIVTKTIPQ